MAKHDRLDEQMGRAAALRHAGQHQAAVAAFDEILRQSPRHAGALTSRGSALLSLGQAKAAEASFRGAYAVLPHHPVTLWNLGTLLVETERPTEALALADAALRVNPRNARAALLRADALCGMGKFTDSLPDYDRAREADDVAYEALSKGGLAQASAGHYDDALRTLAEAVGLRPQDPMAIFFRGLVRLQLKDFAAWTDYEARWDLGAFIEKSGGIVSRELAAQLVRHLSSADLRGQRVLLIAEQAIGDQVMFASILPDLEGLVRTATLVCEPRLVRLFSASFPWLVVTAPSTARIATQDVDRLVALGSLAMAFRATGDSFPKEPFLAPSPAIRAGWRARLGPRRTRLRIGISWRGGAAITRRQHRSLALEQLRPLLTMPECEFVSLQYGDHQAELDAMNATLERPIQIYAEAMIDDFEDLAALVLELDLVVSVQTALVHLAGAVGQDCLTLISNSPEWRYGAHGATLPWYSSVRLFRQTDPGDWEPVLTDVMAVIRARLAAAPVQPS